MEEHINNTANTKQKCISGNTVLLREFVILGFHCCSTKNVESFLLQEPLILRLCCTLILSEGIWLLSFQSVHFRFLQKSISDFFVLILFCFTKIAQVPVEGNAFFLSLHVFTEGTRATLRPKCNGFSLPCRAETNARWAFVPLDSSHLPWSGW